MKMMNDNEKKAHARAIKTWNARGQRFKGKGKGQCPRQVVRHFGGEFVMDKASPRSGALSMEG